MTPASNCAVSPTSRKIPSQEAVTTYRIMMDQGKQTGNSYAYAYARLAGALWADITQLRWDWDKLDPGQLPERLWQDIEGTLSRAEHEIAAFELADRR